MARPGLANAVPGLRLLKQGDAVFVLLDGAPPWMLAPGHFQTGATVTTDGQETIWVTVPLSAGHSADITLRFSNTGGEVQLWADVRRWPATGTCQGVSLAAFLQGRASLEMAVPGSAHRAMVADVVGESVTVPGSVRLRLHRAAPQGLGVALRASAGPFRLPGGFECRLLEVCPAPSAVPGWRATALDIGFPRTMTLGSSGRQVVTLDLPASSKVVMAGTPAVTHVMGRLALHVATGALREGPVVASEARFSDAGTEARTDLQLFDGHWTLRTRHAAFGASGTHLVARVVRSGTRLHTVDLPVRLHDAGLGVAGAEYSRLDFQGAEACLHLPGLAGRSGAIPIPLGGATTLSLPLDKARLRLARSADLMSLALRFHLVTLELGAARPALRLMPAPKPEGNQEAETPLLVADFPPQHVMEEAFLRQDVALPDHGEPLTALDLQVLQGPDRKLAQLRRAEVSNRKLPVQDACDCKPAPVGAAEPGQEEFKRFADAWRVLFEGGGDVLKGLDKADHVPWIGPAGLTGPRVRQAARDLAWGRRRDRIDRAKASLALAPRAPGGAADTLPPAAVVEAMQLLGVPDLGVEKLVLQDIRTRLGRSDDAGSWGRAASAMLRLAANRSGDHARLQAAWTNFREREHLAGAPETFFTAAWPPEFTQAAPDPLFSSAQISPVTEQLALTFLRDELGSLAEDHGTGVPRKEDGFTVPAQARLSGPSRLAFELKLPPPWTLEGLTDWSAMELRVIRRAQRYDGKDPKKPADVVRLADILYFQRLTKSDGMAGSETENALSRMKEIADAARAPGANDTAIEIPSRLLLSPDQHARWRAPRGRAGLTRALGPWQRTLWQVDLVEADPDAASLRAVWSPDFRAGAFDGTGKVVSPQPGVAGRPDGLHFRTSMDALDRHELVGLSSLHGLPVLARRGNDGVLHSSQSAADPDYTLKTEVFDPDTKKLVRADAIYLPQALTAKRLALSALGGWMDLEARFTPPAASRVHGNGGDRDLFEALSLERWAARIVMGREELVEVVRKGFLYPLGHRASLVRTTQREITYRHGDNGVASGPYAASVQRLAIEPVTEPKHYPAPGQPYAAQDCIARAAAIITTRTPDLLDPVDEIKPAGSKAPSAERLRDTPLGNVRVPEGEMPLAGLVFWPRTEPGMAGTVTFRVTLDGRPQPVGMKLLFVDNRAAHDQATMQAVAERYWEPEPLPPAATQAQVDVTGVLAEPVLSRFDIVRHDGVPRTYALEEREGDCTFVTDWQQVGVHGHEGPDRYLVSPQMEAADQPPFYPVLRQAAIRPQQVAALTGRPADAMRIRFNPSYVRNGFREPAAEPLGQQFIGVCGPRFPLDMGRKGEQAGGVGRPALIIRAFDRKLGPDSRERRVGDGQPSGEVTLLTQGSSAGFFSDDAKLLGLFTFNQLIDAMGQATGDGATSTLREVLDYGGEAADAALATAVPALAGPVAKLRTALHNLVFEAAYVGLVRAVDALDAAVTPKTLDKTDKDFKPPPAASERLASMWAAGQQVVAELRQLAKAPLAPVADFLFKAVQELEAALQSALKDGAIWTPLRTAVAGTIAGLLEDGAWSEAVVTTAGIAGLTDDEAKVLESAVRRAVADPATWLSPDPVGSVAAAALQDAAIKAWVKDKKDLVTARALSGPLAQEVLGVAHSLQAAAGGALKDIGIAVNGVLTEYDRLTGLLAGAAAQCVAGAEILRDWAVAAIPEAADTRPLVQAIRDGADAVGQIPAELEKLTSLDPIARAAYVNWATQLHKQLDLAVTLVEQRVAKVLVLRQQVVAGLPSGAEACAALAGSVVAAVNGLIAGRAGVVAAALQIVDWLPKAAEDGKPAVVPLPPVPVGAEAVASLVQGKLAAAAAAAIELVLDATVAAADPGIIARGAGTPAALRKAARDAVFAASPAKEQVAAIVAEAALLRARAAALRTAADQLPAAAAALRAEVTAKVEAALRDVQDAALREAMRRMLAAVPALAAAVQAIGSALAGVRTAAGVAYRSLTDARGRAYVTLTNAAGDPATGLAAQLLGPVPAAAGPCQTGGWPSAILLLPGARGACAPDKDALTDEMALTTEASDPGLKDLRTLLGLWASNISAVQRIVANAGQVLQAGVRSAVTRLLDVAELRQKITEALQDIVPSSRTVKFSYDLPLGEQFPENGEGIFVFKALPLAEGVVPALTLRSDTKVSANLSGTGQAVQVAETFKGELPAFDLTVFKSLTIRFDPITYAGGTGQSGKLTARVNTVTFGENLQFLQKLQAWLSPGGTGPYVRLTLDRPAIEAGYVLSIGTIMLGTLSISNINFAAACLLPFDGKDARFSFSLGTLDQPFLLSAAPYGGGGFFGLEAGAGGIVAAHASFEYGAVAAVSFGPLTGFGRVTTGIYMHSEDHKTQLTGLFFAGFAGHIACFGVVVTFTLRLAIIDGGAIGTAVLFFSFSLGFLKATFKVTAKRTIGQNFDAGEKKKPKDAASLEQPGLVMAVSDGQRSHAGQAKTRPGIVTTDVRNAHSDWDAHARYFDNALVPGVLP